MGLGPALIRTFRIETHSCAEVQASSSGLLSGRFLPITATLQILYGAEQGATTVPLYILAHWTITQV
jgi:hypothetical protein